MKTMRRSLLLMAAALVAVVIVVSGSALFWISSDHCLQWVVSRVNTAIPGKIAIERHRLSFLKPGLDLYGGMLYAPRGTPLAGFAHLAVRLDWLPLLRREIRLEEILLADPWTDLALLETGGLNFMAALGQEGGPEKTEAIKPDGPVFPFNLVFRSIRLVGGRLSFRPPQGNHHLAVTGIALTADGDLMARSGSLGLELADVRFSGAGIRTEPARIALKARLDGDKLKVPAVDVTSGRTTMKISGSADDLYTMPVVDSVLSLDSQLADLKAVFNLAGDYTGPVNTRLTIKGSVADPDAGLFVTVGGGRIAGQPVDRGDLSIHLRDRQAAIESASFRLADGAVTLNGTIDLRQAFPTGFFTPPENSDAIAYDLTMVQDTPDLTPWLNRFVDITGKMTGRLALSGKGLTPAAISARIALDASGRDLLAPGMDRPMDANVNLTARMDRGTISISRLHAAAESIELSGNGRFQMDGSALSGNLSLTADDLTRAFSVAGAPPVSGSCSAALTVGGSLNQPQFSVDLAARGLKAGTHTIGDLTIDAGMDPDGLLDLATLALNNQGSRIRGNARLRLLPDGGGIDPGFVNTLDLTLEKVSAADFMESPPIQGALDGRLRLDGPLESLRGELSISGRGLIADTAAIGDLDTLIRLDNGTIFVDRLHLNNHDSTFTATGNIRLLAPGTMRLLEDPAFDFTAGSKHLDPGHFFDMASGDFTFDGTLTGSLEKPVGRLTLAGSQIDVAGQSVASLSLDARFEEQRLWLDRLLATLAPGEQIEGAGWLDLDQTVDFQITSTGIAVSRIRWLKEVFPGKGRLHIDATGQGRMDNPDIRGRLSVSDITVNGEAMDDIDLTVSLHDMQARAEGNLNFEMDAACDLEKGDFKAHLIFDGTETGAYFKAAGKPGFHGTLTGRVQAAGNIHNITNASAQVDLTALNLMFEEISLARSEKIALQLADRDLSISDLDLAILSHGNLHIQGDARLDGRLDLVADGRIPLAAAGVFSDLLADATGIVAVSGSISGQTAAPQFDARINLEKIGMTVPGLVQELRNLNGSVHLTPETIGIDALEGSLDTGSFAVAGTIDHDKFQPVRMDIHVNARSLPLEVPDTLAVRVNSDIQIKGKGRSATANGEIVLLEGVYYKDVKINLLEIASTAAKRQRAVAPAPRPVTVPFFDTVNLDIVASHRQPFAVQNNLAQMDISPDLRISGTLANPIISGRAQVRNGTVTFQKRDFDVKRGIIDFVNPYRTEAKIDIESEAEIRTWKINLAIKGTTDNLDVTLTSVPAETEADILSLILFGRTAQELTGGEGGTQRTTGQIMAEMIADTFGDGIKKSTGMDILQLETTGGDGTDAEGVKVTVGKHLSDRMTVKYAIETNKSETTQWAIMEYKLLERILVNGSQSNTGLFGAELVYRIEFR